MIRFATLHDLGMPRLPRNGRGHRGHTHRYILKYFDPWMPLDETVSEFKYWQRKPTSEELVETCLVESEDHPLYEWTRRNAPMDIQGMVPTLILGNLDELFPFIDMWNDAGFLDAQVYGKPLDHRKLLLFLFWQQKGIFWDKRLFLQCNPPFTPRRTYRDET